ncbi:MAG: thioredoxin family protein [Bryobacteraceae bacterium]|nr:thioredoxin family protein [Bryobacteraceae bacterium]MDW8376991.1 cytochrome c biogenesis protein CcdA [Bryobacterales bacterium]
MAPQVRPGGYTVGKLTAKIEEPWHLYSPTTPPGGPIVTTIRVEHEAFEQAEVWRPQPVRKLDPNFGIDTETYDKEAVFYLRVKIKTAASEGEIEPVVTSRYQACTETQCLPPVRRPASAKLVLRAGAADISWQPPPGYALVAAQPERKVSTSSAPSGPNPLTSLPQADQGLWRFALVAFGLGLAAVFTPCVFPMIPFTVSYFLSRQQGSRAESLIQAGVFSAGIILLFTSIGLLTTALLGPFGVLQLAASPWVNAFLAIMFIAFALSLLGAFEITLPSSLLTKLNRASERGGLLGSLLMGLTFSLTAFACVGPFVGSLLAASVQGDRLQPTVGMLGFATGLASPFFLLALFPSQLSSLPKSGGWLPRVKIVFGFVLLAISLKYLSTIDQVLGWNVLTRERFLAVWIVLFSLPGLYLLGFLRMEGIRPDQNLGVGRSVLGAAFLAFSLSLVPGMFCGKLGDLDAYVPLPAEGACLAPGGAGAGERLVWMKNQYREALEKARAENKLVLVNFTGYACTNCHWMKANMFPRPEVQAELKNFVLVELYTDGADETSAKNQDLQNQKFATVAIPFYALLDADEKVIATFPRLTKDPAEFVAFLRTRQT